MPRPPNPLELTRELLCYETVNPPGKERACAEYLGALLEEGGLDVRYHDFAPDRTSLVARLEGSGNEPPLCFTGHIDVVPLGVAPWNCPAFTGETDQGRLYGRGSSDMKSGVAAFVHAVLDLAKLPRPQSGLVLVITAGEETGCEGAAFLAACEGALGRAGAIVVGEPTANCPYVGHKGALWLEAKTRGVTAHGSMPDKGVNAIYKAARAINKLEQFHFTLEAHPQLGMPTFNVGTMRAGLNVNSVPDQAVFTIDIRTVPEQSHEAVRDELAAYLGDEVALRPLIDARGIWTDPEDVWVKEVFGMVKDVAGEEPPIRTATYFTDGSYLASAYSDAPTLVLGPGEPVMAHQTDEYCELSRIDEAVEIYRRIATSWCGY